MEPHFSTWTSLKKNKIWESKLIDLKVEGRSWASAENSGIKIPSSPFFLKRFSLCMWDTRTVHLYVMDARCFNHFSTCKYVFSRVLTVSMRRWPGSTEYVPIMCLFFCQDLVVVWRMYTSNSRIESLRGQGVNDPCCPKSKSSVLLNKRIDDCDLLSVLLTQASVLVYSKLAASSPVYLSVLAALE
jgi:hypothetical protein